LATAISHGHASRTPAPPPTLGLVRYPISLLAAVVAVSVAACGSSTSGQPTATPAKRKANDHVAGLISSVAGNTIQVALQNGSATVDFADSTKISSLAAAQVSDVTAGDCVVVRPTRDSTAGGGSITAARVQIIPASDGQCPHPRGGRELIGAVGSVNGTTLTLNTAGTSAPTSVSVTNKTRYARRTPANAQAISQGECLSANGTDDTSGALQATSITVRPARNGSCATSKR
jgi:hypothetical protein